MAPTVETARRGTIWPRGALVEKTRSETRLSGECDGPIIALLTMFSCVIHLEVGTRDRLSFGASKAMPVQTGLFGGAPKRLANAWFQSRQPVRMQCVNRGVQAVTTKPTIE